MMSYLEHVKDAKVEASSHLWYRVLTTLFHICLGGVVGAVVVSNIINSGMQWWQGILLFFGILFVEQFLMRNIELLIFGSSQ